MASVDVEGNYLRPGHIYDLTTIQLML